MKKKTHISNTAHESKQGILSVVATPIGNLGDFSPRAKSTLITADIIVAEDTRKLRSLLGGENIQALLLRGDSITENKIVQKIIDALYDGKRVALITDAGTPGISDPGYIIVSKVREIATDITIEVLPGPSALTAALSISGIPATPFTFLGFPPAKKGRTSFFKKILEIHHTIVLYESPHKFMKSLTELHAVVGGKRTIFVGRELTKMHEEGNYGTLDQIILYYKNNPEKVRGEFVLVIKGN
ncbi:MAG: hypothetical protein RL641_191 [Candidatus Parcubacteria bacterium]|jgi:16S rRNA (cytidine1402-2'-O)-methyltransferase